MNEQLNQDAPTNEETQEAYHAPRLINYGAVSEITENLAGPGSGDDMGYPSYTVMTS